MFYPEPDISKVKTESFEGYFVELDEQVVAKINVYKQDGEEVLHYTEATLGNRQLLIALSYLKWIPAKMLCNKKGHKVDTIRCVGRGFNLKDEILKSIVCFIEAETESENE